MKRDFKYFAVIPLFTALLSIVFVPFTEGQSDPDSSGLQFPLKEDPTNPLPGSILQSPLFLENPSNVQTDIVYDPVSNSYVFSEKIGKINIRTPGIMTFDEYRQYEMDQAKTRYWQQRRSGDNLETQASFIPAINVGGEAFDRVFGTNTININSNCTIFPNNSPSFV